MADESGAVHVTEKSGRPWDSWVMFWLKVFSDIVGGCVQNSGVGSRRELVTGGNSKLELVSVDVGGTKKLVGVSISVNMAVSTFS